MEHKFCNQACLKPRSADLQLNLVEEQSLIFCPKALSVQSLDILSESTLSSLSEILQLRHFLLVYVGWWPRLLGCKKGLLNLHSQQPFLTQSVASCHITLPSCPPSRRRPPLQCFSLLQSSTYSKLLLLQRTTSIARDDYLGRVNGLSQQSVYGGQGRRATHARDSLLAIRISGALADKVSDRQESHTWRTLSQICLRIHFA